MNLLILINTFQYRKIGRVVIAACFLLITHPKIATSQTQNSLRVLVNSNQDGAIKADDALTLREAIEIVNGTLSLDKLSPSERALVQTYPSPRIEFNLPPGQTTISLQQLLPPLAIPDLVVDGTTQPGYDSAKSPTAEISIPQPIVSITPEMGVEVFRGFTVIADRVSIRGFSLYGFTSQHGATQTTPPADIFITSGKTNFPRDAEAKNNFSVYGSSEVPQNVLIENNWLGITPNADMPPITSAFGVSVFNAGGTVIRRNRISYHDGSGIITGNQAGGTQVIENIILGNGIAGMPDAIHLDGVIDKSEIRSNLICANDGSGVFLFKPEGSVQIRNNQIKFNGRRFRRAAIFVMGTDHQIQDNQIRNQNGPGVVVSAFPPGGSFSNGAAVRNLIQNNRFTNLEGLSIDLNTRGHVGVEDFQRGDGKNPQRDSPNRRLDTGNAAINAPEFLASEFLIMDGKVNLDGVADPGSEIEIYRVDADGALAEVLTTVTTDGKGRFGVTLKNLQPGMRVSAIATDPKYGTSEPSYNALLVTKTGEKFTQSSQQTPDIPNCLTPPIPPEPIPVPEPTPEPIRLEIPKNVHFALDKDNISPTTAQVLNKIAQVLRNHPSIIVELLGHTDKRATDVYNLDLAARRAKNTRNYLIRQGIAPERMTIRSLGERELLTPGIRKLDHARNRRVEFIFQDIRGIEVIIQETDLQLEQ